jgi:hypothetical protein
MSKFFKGLKKAKAVEPRVNDEINKEYTNLCMNLGSAEFRKSLLQKEIDSIINRMNELNAESAARMKIDSAKSKEEVKEVSEVSNG